MPTPPSFQIAAFGSDGLLVGTSPFDFGQLSRRWVAEWHEALSTSDGNFDGSLHSRFDHIRHRVTWSGTVALATSLANDHIATSSILLAGAAPSAEAEAVDMFCLSLMQHVPGLAQANPRAFSDLKTIRQRPLFAVMVWGNPNVSEEDYELVTQLEWHLAAALFESHLTLQKTPAQGQ